MCVRALCPGSTVGNPSRVIGTVIGAEQIENDIVAVPVLESVTDSEMKTGTAMHPRQTDETETGGETETGDETETGEIGEMTVVIAARTDAVTVLPDAPVETFGQPPSDTNPSIFSTFYGMLPGRMR
eukprot:m.311396 g.311396  ORF g.311396 m.311396 type:complete len:127 (+) comp20221_c0_seq10:333-713(+)